MKRILSFLILAVMMMSLFVGCGKTDRVLYNGKMSKYIDLGKYEGIEVDTKSDDYKQTYDAIIDEDVKNNNLYVQKKEGTVAEGDTANIDYEGKKDGVAFEGGTAQGYDLTIGSDSFIDGFEDGLIGKKIGDTVDLNLTFPKDYGSTDLAGKAVVFTVKINYVTTDEPLEPAEFYNQLGFGSEAKYIEDVNKRATEEILLSKLTEASKIKSYPEKELDYLYSESKRVMEMNLQNYGYDFTTYLSSIGQTEEQFKKDTIENQIKPMMEAQMVLYAVLDDAGLEVTKTDIDGQAEKIVKEYDNQVTVEQVKEYYGDYQLEFLAVSEKAMKIIYDNAKIK